MGSFSIWHWLIVLAVAVLLFGGGGKIARIMGDFGKGVRNLKEGLKGDGEAAASSAGAPAAQVEDQASVVARTAEVSPQASSTDSSETNVRTKAPKAKTAAAKK